MNESSVPADDYENFEIPLEMIRTIADLPEAAELPGHSGAMSGTVPSASEPAPQVMHAAVVDVHLNKNDTNMLNKNDAGDKPIVDGTKPGIKRALKSENAITGRGPKVLSTVTPVVFEETTAVVDGDETLPISWRTVVEQFCLRYDLVFLKMSAKAHLDSCDLGTRHAFDCFICRYS